MVSKCFQWEVVETLHFTESIVACDLKIDRYRQFTVLIKICEYSRSSLLFTLTDMNLSKGRLSKNIPQVSDIRTIGPLVSHLDDIEIGLS